jgi:hypothetical protein
MAPKEPARLVQQKTLPEVRLQAKPIIRKLVTEAPNKAPPGILLSKDLPKPSEPFKAIAASKD